MAYFPMFVDLTDKPCLVVGGGEVAYRKVRTLLDFDAEVTVVAESVCPKLAGLAEACDITSEGKILSACGQDAEKAETSDKKMLSACDCVTEKGGSLRDKITICVRPFQKEDCDGKLLVVAATDDKDLNHNIAEYCKAAGIMVNAVDQKDDCSFIFSSYVKEQNLVAAFSSGGKSPVLTQYLKKKEADILTPFLGTLNEYMGDIRADIISKYDSEEERKRAFCDIVYSAIENQKLP